MPSFKERFWNKVDKTDSCWLWKAAKDERGYGIVRLPYPWDMPQDIQRTHRVAWILTNGGIPSGMFVLHKCDVPSCVNPDHLFLGTQKDNIRDMMRKKRDYRGSKHGESNGRHKLTSGQVETIRTAYDTGLYPYSYFAKEFGISISQVARIIKGESWIKGR